MEEIRVFKPEDREYKLLDCVAQLLTILSPNKYQYYVGDTYFDYDQDWKWTTILCHKTNEGSRWDFQALNPMLQKRIIQAKDIGDIGVAVSMYFHRRNCLDRKRNSNE